ncbi:glycine cleavage system protein T [Sulfodiicoccus acidiphilus]|uniref:Glycine cleavage system protein T n=2 Tax=Sulfodiicoccus acidiphilus TaxID=1670455 RepID=A0A348B3G9_9CREN|nr:glycine cleavage system protein T [Sulfodiicoccus acidiphilus]GGT95300.1 glycine cleavage system protein T [Sulfodiicoccus acidiphilus]
MGADFGVFAGWSMPMSYGSYLDEHMAVRSSAAFFDLSHMGRLMVTGKKEEFEYLVAKAIGSTEAGKMVGPTAFLTDKGTFVDDVMIYVLGESSWLVVTNAVNREKVASWIKRNSGLEVEDLTMEYAMVAVQGRRVWEFTDKVEIEPLSFKKGIKYMGIETFLLSRSGWTGEDGVEIWARPEEMELLLRKLRTNGIKPAGLIARDSLRQEMGFVLYGEDIDETVNPLEARYWVFSLEKEFLGRNALVQALRTGVTKIRVGLKLKKGERVIPRRDSKIMVEDQEIGVVTSSTYSPYLTRVIGMGYVKSSHLFLGYSSKVEVRGRRIEAKLTDFPLV